MQALALCQIGKLLKVHRACPSPSLYGALVNTQYIIIVDCYLKANKITEILSR